MLFLKSINTTSVNRIKHLITEVFVIKNVQIFLQKCSILPLKMFNSPLVYIRIRLELDIEWRGNNISVIEVESGKYKEEYYFKYEA